MAKVVWELTINGEVEICFRRKKDALKYVELYKLKHNIEKLEGARLKRWFPYPKASYVVWAPKDSRSDEELLKDL